MKIFLFFIIFLLLTSCTSFRNKDSSTDQSLIRGIQCQNLGQQRGVVVAFVQDAPHGQEYHETQPFPVSLRFANYYEDPVSVSYSVLDTTGYEGFADVDASVTVAGAEYQENLGIKDTVHKKFIHPGCMLLEEDYPELSFGLISYEGIPTDDSFHYVATIDYDATSFAYGNYCLYNPSYGDYPGCSRTETFAGAQLGDHSLHDPVAITKVTKSLVGTKDAAVLTLTIDLQNLGGGFIPTEEQEEVTFTLDAHNLPFSCTSDTAVDITGGSTLTLGLDTQGIAHVLCTAEFMAQASDYERQLFEITLDYPYSYAIASSEVTIRKNLHANTYA